ncbi:MAG: GNAT family N-acetyltransferase [Candidatus Poribacteria bacterium]|nr:GNAT family N-acetyltransferase [Candidatus Poribacteria bacterium]
MATKDFDLRGKLNVRSAQEDDANHLQTYCFPEKTIEQVAEELKADLATDSQTTRLVADASGYAVGHITVKQHPLNDEVGQISDLAVSGPFRLLGVADHLIEAAEAAAIENDLKILEIELATTDTPVIQRYKDWGFSEKPIVTLQKDLNIEEEGDEEEKNEETQVNETDAEQQSLLN